MMLGQLHSYILLQRHELLHVLWRTIWKYNVIQVKMYIVYGHDPTLPLIQ